SAILSGWPSDTDSDVNKYAIIIFVFFDIKIKERCYRKLEVKNKIEWFLALFFRGCNLPFYLRFVKCKSVHIFILSQSYNTFIIITIRFGDYINFYTSGNLDYIYSVDYRYGRTEEDSICY